MDILRYAYIIAGRGGEGYARVSIARKLVVLRSFYRFLVQRGLFRTSLDFVFEPSGPLVWLSVCVLLAAVASLLPAWHASRCPVREAIAYE